MFAAVPFQSLALDETTRPPRLAAGMHAAVLKQSSWGFLHVVRVGGFGGVSLIDATAIKFVQELYWLHVTRKTLSQIRIENRKPIGTKRLRASCCYNRGNGCGENATRASLKQLLLPQPTVTFVSCCVWKMRSVTKLANLPAQSLGFATDAR
jgi:hypothetical protein